MTILDLLSRVLRTVLRLMVWAVAALLALTLLSVALVALLTWALVSLLLGRKPQVNLGARFQSMRQFGGTFGQGGFRTGGIWPRQQDGPQEPRSSNAPLAQRIARPEAVVDVEAKEPSQRHRS